MKIRSFLGFVVWILLFGGASTYLVNSALTDMTAQDCHVNKIQRACDSLK